MFVCAKLCKQHLAELNMGGGAKGSSSSGVMDSFLDYSWQLYLSVLCLRFRSAAMEEDGLISSVNLFNGTVLVHPLGFSRDYRTVFREAFGGFPLTLDNRPPSKKDACIPCAKYLYWTTLSYKSFVLTTWYRQSRRFKGPPLPVVDTYTDYGYINAMVSILHSSTLPPLLSNTNTAVITNAAA
jgi:hypothetical protein